MPTKPMPPRPSLDRFKAEARRLMRDRAAADPQACQRLREFHPRLAEATDPAIAAADLGWSDALLTIAREYGFASWPRLKARVEGPSRPGEWVPHHERIEDPVFRRAVELIDDGDAAGLAAHLAAHPGLATCRVAFEGGNYFRNPGLICFVAENPVRNDSLPPNIVEIARIVLDAGASRDQAALNETLMLVSSGRVAREAGAQIALIDLLCGYGAKPDEAAVAAAAHGEFEAAQALLHNGARLTLPVAAALGLDADAHRLLDSASAAERHLALALAAQHGRAGILRLLLDAGEDPSRYNPPGAHSHSTPLHQAVWGGHDEAVRLLVERGARLDLRDSIHQATPIEWAEYGKRSGIAGYLREAEAARRRGAGDSAGARPLLVRAVALAREKGDETRLGHLLARLGQIERDLGNAAAAIDCYSEAAAIARENGSPLQLAHRLRHIGDILLDAGEPEAAEPFFEEALAIYRGCADTPPLDLANAVRPLALLRERQGRAEEAKALWAEARLLYDQAGIGAGASESAARLAAADGGAKAGETG